MSEKKVFKYEIGGVKYTQQALVWAQMKQLKNLLHGIKFEGGFDIMNLIDVLGDKLSRAVAIVLREDGKSLKEKDIDVLEESLDDALELEVVVGIVDDFFLCNRIGSLLEKLKKVFGNLIPEMDLTALTDQSPLSQEVTSQSRKKSSGDTPPKNAEPVSNTATEK